MIVFVKKYLVACFLAAGYFSDASLDQTDVLLVAGRPSQLLCHFSAVPPLAEYLVDSWTDVEGGSGAGLDHPLAKLAVTTRSQEILVKLKWRRRPTVSVVLVI